MLQELQITEKLPIKGLVYVFHGYGANNENLYDVALAFSKIHSSFRFIIPNGIERFENGGSGYQWFSLSNFTQQALQAKLENVAPKVSGSIQEKLKKCNLTENNLYLIGFSQGGMLAMYSVAAALLKPKQVIAFSSMFVPPKKIDSQLKQTEILATHGDTDTVLPLQMSKFSYEFLKQYGLLNFNLMIERNIGHSISQASLNNAISFLKL